MQDDTGKLLPPGSAGSKDLVLYDSVRDREGTLALKAPIPTEFGSIEELQKDHEWVARYNQANIVNSLAAKEFEENKDDIIAWYEKKIKERRQLIIDQTCRMSWPVKFENWSYGFVAEKEAEEINWVKLKHDRLGHFSNYYEYYTDGTFGTGRQIGTYSNSRRCYICPIDGVKCSLVQSFRVETPDAISEITGIPIEQLPEPLQHYYKREPYYGNSILERLDPMDWVVDNPWIKLQLGVRVLLSKSGFNRRRGQLHLPLFRDWESITPEER